MDNGVVGVGYEGRSLEEFLDLLQKEGVQVLLDARLVPRCSRRGFSRYALAETLQTIGISYVNYQILGVSEFEQVGFRGDRAAAAAASARYRSRLGTPFAQRVLRDLVQVARHRRVAVMTMFADEDRCHRGTLMAEIARRTPVATPIEDLLAEFPETTPAVPVFEHDPRTQIERDIDALLAEVDAGKR